MVHLRCRAPVRTVLGRSLQREPVGCWRGQQRQEQAEGVRLSRTDAPPAPRQPGEGAGQEEEHRWGTIFLVGASRGDPDRRRQLDADAGTSANPYADTARASSKGSPSCAEAFMCVHRQGATFRRFPAASADSDLRSRSDGLHPRTNQPQHRADALHIVAERRQQLPQGQDASAGLP